MLKDGNKRVSTENIQIKQFLTLNKKFLQISSQTLDTSASLSQLFHSCCCLRDTYVC